MLILGGALIALFFEGISALIYEKLPKVSKKVITVFTVVCFFIFLGFTTYFLLPRIAEQVVILKNELPEALSSIKNAIQSDKALSYVLKFFNKIFDSNGFSENIQGFFSSIFGFIGDIYIMITLGAFFLIQPGVYKNGIVKLFPLDKRKKILEGIVALSDILKKWLLGKISSMLVVGVLTGVGLFFLDIPLVLSLALIATFTAFIPNIGPIIALIPALLISFIKGGNYVMYTFLLYSLIQLLESNIITPLIQKEAISFPMALILIAQVVLGVFTGYLGLILATPVMAIFLYLVKVIYVKNYLGDKN